MIQATFILFLFGAILGTFGDWLHVASETLGYPNPLFPLPGTGQPIWVPFLFGGATLLIGLSHPWVDQWLGYSRVKRGWISISTGIALFLALYGASGFLPMDTGGAKDLVLLSSALLIWFSLDRTWQGLVLGMATGLMGTFFEMSLTHTGLFYYYPTQSNFKGVPSWLPWLYLAASVTTGNFGRLLLKSKNS